MTRILRAHFDGKTLVPDEPVDLPVNEPVLLRITEVLPPFDAAAAREALIRLEQFVVHGTNIPDEALRRENIYDENA